MGMRNRFFRKTNRWFDDKKNVVGSWHVDNNTLDYDFLLLDLKMDLPKILTPEEILIFNKSHDKLIKNIKIDDWDNMGILDCVIYKILTYR
jgi:hypothetical protein